MNYLAIAAVLVCAALMFVLKRKVKAGLLLLATMFFTLVRIPVIPFGSNSIVLLTICFLLSEAKYYKSFSIVLRRSIVARLMILVAVGGAVCISFSPHLSSLRELKSFFIMEYLIKYFVLAYGLWAFRRPGSIRPALEISFWGLVVMTALGMLNVVVGYSPFVQSVMPVFDETGLMRDLVDAEHFEDRFRVQATFMNPFDYGYINLIVMALHTYAFRRGYESRLRYAVVAACAVFGIVACGCRTVLFCALVGTAVYLLLTVRSKRGWILTSGGVICSLALVLAVPFLRERAFQLSSMFDSNSEVSGSSFDMRVNQYLTVLEYVDGDLILFGNGYGYFVEDLGWGDQDRGSMDSDLFGLEGVLMNLMLERGIAGCMFHIIFYFSLLAYMFRWMRFRQTAALGITVLVMYLVFANMTGELLSVYPTLLITGYVIRSLDFERRYFVWKRGSDIR